MANKSMTTILEQSAIAANAAGVPWRDWWPTVAGDVARAEPYNRLAFHALVRRLVGLVAAGDTDGAEPVENPLCPWDEADARAQAVPVLVTSDTATAARCLWSPEVPA